MKIRFSVQREEWRMKTETFYLLENRPDVRLKSYIWEDSPQLLNGRKRPAVIICPGGGYLQAGDNEGEPTAFKFASMGYHAFVLHYSTYHVSFEDFFGLFATLDGTAEHAASFLKKYPPSSENMYPMPMIDIGRAMLLIREHAEEWNVDMDRIALCGFSAGAHNSAMFCTNWHKPVITDALSCKSEDIRPAALILGYTVSDYPLMNAMRNAAPAPIAEFFDISNTLFTGSAAPEGERAELLSPSRNVDEHTPPTFLWAVADDTLVPVQNTLLMGTALADHHVPFEMHIFEHGQHGIGLGTQASAGTKEQIFEDAGKWSDLAGKWLEKRFALFR